MNGNIIYQPYQDYDSRYQNFQVANMNIFFIFIVYPCMGLQFVVNLFSVCIYFLYLMISHSLLDFNKACASLYLMHALQVKQFSG